MKSKIELTTGAFGNPGLGSVFTNLCSSIGNIIKAPFTAMGSMFGVASTTEVAKAGGEVAKTTFDFSKMLQNILQTGLTSFAQFKVAEMQYDLQKSAQETQAQPTVVYYQEPTTAAPATVVPSGIDTKTIALIGGLIVGGVVLTVFLTKGKKK